MSKVAEIIREEIQEHGAIPFARFMELALYCPVYGYYEKEEDTLGRRGDYYTSVSVGPLFGELLAFQFAEWFKNVQSPKSKVQSREGTVNSQETTGQGAAHSGPDTLVLIEAGAHRGDLARDILGWFCRQRPELYDRIEYWIIEPSSRRREWQWRALADFASQVRWAARLGEIGGGVALWPRILFSNELLDAMPVHRFGWDARGQTWFEWGVTVRAGRLEWIRLDGAASAGGTHCVGLNASDSGNSLWCHGSRTKADGAEGKGEEAVSLGHGICSTEHGLPSGLLSVLPDGFVLEHCPAAETWWREAAVMVPEGKILTFDYGLSAEELLAPERKDGTLRAYHRHRVSRNLLDFPGEQDLTAHVNFTRVEAAGGLAGLTTEALVSQTQFLTTIASRAWEDGSGFGKWTPERTRQFQTLTHPEHLGHAFKVLLQSRLRAER